MKRDRDFHRLVRVVYRACRKLYGKEKTQDECLKVFKVVFPELYRLRNSTEEYVDVPFKLLESLLLITNNWNPHRTLSGVVSHAIGQLQMSLSWKREELMQFYEDIMPVVMRIRKLTPRECYRLMGVSENDIDTLLNSGISNSGHYKLAGNSIVVDVMTNIFDTLLINTEQKKEVGMQLTLF
ncbi:MAG: DNA cytosine methyltransferase [Prevotella sp.]|nr:DNA cytosine methyltransferase [Prevotella sp.]